MKKTTLFALFVLLMNFINAQETTIITKKPVDSPNNNTIKGSSFLYDHDISIEKIINNNYLSYNSSYIPKAKVKNKGTETETFKVACNIYQGMSTEPVYNDTLTITDLSQYNWDTATFSSFVLSSPNEVYNVVITSLLPNDMNPSNDTLSNYIFSCTLPRDMVLLEIFTGVTCGYCPGAALGADDLIENGKHVAISEYHSYSPSHDPFSNADALRRNSYYSIASAPTSIFDGVLRYSGGSTFNSIYETYLPMYEDRIQVNSPVKIDFEANYYGKDMSVKVTVTKNVPINDDNLVLHLLLNESHIEYDWSFLTEVNFVERVMIPNGYGTNIDLVNNTTVTNEFNFEINDEWNIDNMEIIAFIQSNNNKEVLNTHKEPLVSVGINENMSKYPVDLKLYPNPVKSQLSIELKLNEQSQVNIEIYDLNAKRIETICSKTMSPGKKILNWYPSKDVSNGLYLLKTTINGKSFMQKFVLQR
jgi:hypothetical protein